MRRAVMLFGNGLSIGVSPRFRLGELTSRVVDRLGAESMAALRELAALGRPDGSSRPKMVKLASFEDIAGPLDRVAEAVRVLRPLAGGTSPSHLDDTYQYLRSHYLSTSGLVLSEIAAAASLPDAKAWDPVNKMARSLIDIRGMVSVFNLSYDTLLESALLKSGRTKIYDGFPWMSIDQPLHPFTGKLPIYHLHGSVLWYASEVYDVKKYASGSTEHSEAIGAWVAGDDSRGLPVVVLTDAKNRAVGAHPFDMLYAEFKRYVNEADVVVVAGYGFGDAPINAVLDDWLRRRWIDRGATRSGTLEIWSVDEQAIGTAKSVLPSLMASGEESVPGDALVFRETTLPSAEAVDALGTRLRVGQ